MSKYEKLPFDVEYLPINRPIAQALANIDTIPVSSDDYAALFEQFCGQECTSYDDCNSAQMPQDVKNFSSFCFLAPESDETDRRRLARSRRQARRLLDDSAFMYDVYALAQSSAIALNTESVRDIYAIGAYSAISESSLIIEGVMSCEGELSCSYTTETKAKAVYCLGYRSCTRSNIVGVPEVFLFGQDALSGGKVGTEGGVNQTVQVYLEGCSTSFTVKCQNPGDECIVYVFRTDYYEACMQGSSFAWNCHDLATCTLQYYEAPETASPSAQPTAVPISLQPTVSPVDNATDINPTESNSMKFSTTPTETTDAGFGHSVALMLAAFLCIDFYVVALSL